MADTQAATVEAGTFMRAVTNAGLFTSTDDTLPSLTAVHFRPSPQAGFLQLEATNRYVASQENVELADLASYDSDWTPAACADHMEQAHGWQRPDAGPYGGKAVPAGIVKQHAGLHPDPCNHEHTVRPVPVTELNVLVSVKDLAKLVKTFKLVVNPDTRYMAGAERPHVVIEHADGSDRVSFTLVNNAGPDTTISPKVVLHGEFPPIDRLMTDAQLPADELHATLQRRERERQENVSPPHQAKPQPVPDVWERQYMFAAKWLAAIAKVDSGQKEAPVQFRFTASGKPALVAIGENFRALVIPIRNGT